MFKVGIIEDEYFAQRVLINLLKAYEDQLQIVCICSSIEEARQEIPIHQPHFVFLDIKLPGGLGFDIIDLLKQTQSKIIFTTAYDTYAVKAFEASAVDYVLKPILPDRLDEAIKKVLYQLKVEKISQDYEGLKSNLNAKNIQNITVRYRDSYKVIPLSDLLYLKAEGSYTIVKTEAAEYLQSYKLNHFESIFQNAPNMMRVHRSWIVNLDRIKEFSKLHRSLTIETQTIPVSKSNTTSFFTKMQQKK